MNKITQASEPIPIKWFNKRFEFNKGHCPISSRLNQNNLLYPDTTIAWYRNWEIEKVNWNTFLNFSEFFICTIFIQYFTYAHLKIKRL